MENKITRREVLAFILGFMTLFMINLGLDWENNVKAFKEGMEQGRAAATESPEIE